MGFNWPYSLARETDLERKKKSPNKKQLDFVSAQLQMIESFDLKKKKICFIVQSILDLALHFI